MDAYKVNGPGLSHRYYRALGCWEEPKMAVFSLHKCLDGGIIPGNGEHEEDQVLGGTVGYSLRNEEFCFGSFEVKEAMKHPGGVRVAVGYMLLQLQGQSKADTEEWILGREAKGNGIP